MNLYEKIDQLQASVDKLAAIVSAYVATSQVGVGPSPVNEPAAALAAATAPKLAAALGDGLENATSATDAPKPTDYERDVRAPMMELVKLKGSAPVKAILTGLKVDNAKKLAPEQWPDFLAKLAAVKADDSVPFLEGQKS